MKHWWYLSLADKVLSIGGGAQERCYKFNNFVDISWSFPAQFRDFSPHKMELVVFFLNQQREIEKTNQTMKKMCFWSETFGDRVCTLK